MSIIGAIAYLITIVLVNINNIRLSKRVRELEKENTIIHDSVDKTFEYLRNCIVIDKELRIVVIDSVIKDLVEKECFELASLWEEKKNEILNHV
jgi:hypothetical protein